MEDVRLFQVQRLVRLQIALPGFHSVPLKLVCCKHPVTNLSLQSQHDLIAAIRFRSDFILHARESDIETLGAQK